MALTVKEPVVVKPIMASEFRIQEMQFILSGALPVVNLLVAAYAADAAGNFGAIKTWSVSVPPAEFARRLATKEGAAIYAGLKQMLYEWLQSAKEFPTGTIT